MNKKRKTLIKRKKEILEVVKEVSVVSKEVGRIDRIEKKFEERFSAVAKELEIFLRDQ